MRYHFLFFVLALPLLSFSQDTNDFFYHYKQYQTVHSVTLPGWLVKFGAAVGKPFTESEEEQAVFKLMGSVGKLRLLTGGDDLIVSKARQRLLGCLERSGFESLVTVQSKDEDVSLWLKAHPKRSKKNKLVFWISEEDTFTFVQVNTKISSKQLESLIEKVLDIQ